MRFRKRLLSGLIAGILVMGTVGMNVDAAKIQVDQQIPAEEVDSVYNQEVDSNALARMACRTEYLQRIGNCNGYG